jgi:DNA polymerase
MSDVSALLKLIRDGKDAYRDFASVIFGVPYDAVTSEQRGVAKPPVLGGFYMLGGGTRVGKYPDVILTGLMGYAASMGVKIKEADSKQFIAKFRSKYFEVPEMWKKLEDAMIECVQSRQLTRVGHFEFSYQAPFLRLKLPSGRYICYLNPQVKMHTIKHVKGSFTKLAVSYIGKNKAGQYCRVATHPGKIYENLCQAIARDILAYGMLAADKFGFEIVFHVHDEIVALTRDTDQVYNLQKLIELMCIKDKWSRDIPLGAEGYESSFYKKE